MAKKKDIDTVDVVESDIKASELVEPVAKKESLYFVVGLTDAKVRIGKRSIVKKVRTPIDPATAAMLKAHEDHGTLYKVIKE